jgi:hypothetical protein
VNHEELGRALRDAAYLEGDFLLRSGRRSRYYLDKYRFETRPDLLGPLGEAIVAAVREHEPNAVRLAGPELGAVALAASASLAGGLPFLIVRGKAKEYGTAIGSRACTRRASACASSRTSSPPAAALGRSKRCRRASGLHCGLRGRPRRGVSTPSHAMKCAWPLYTASDLLK